MSDLFLSIVIPAFNEQFRIGQSLSSIAGYLKSVSYDYEVIVVDDGSSDQTQQIVQQFSSHFKHLKIVALPKNMGKGRAVQLGMQQAVGRYRLFMDADNSVSISHLDCFVQALQNGADIAVGSIAIQNAHVEDNGMWYRRWLGQAAKRIIQYVTQVGVKDTQRGFKLFTASAADRLFPKLSISGFGFDIELLVMAKFQGMVIRELPVTWINAGGSKVNLSSYVSTFCELLRIRLNMWQNRYTS